jgi:hypothetical protein
MSCFISNVVVVTDILHKEVVQTQQAASFRKLAHYILNFSDILF